MARGMVNAKLYNSHANFINVVRTYIEEGREVAEA